VASGVGVVVCPEKQGIAAERPLDAQRGGRHAAKVTSPLQREELGGRLWWC
jgi:hypothetical protein